MISEVDINSIWIRIEFISCWKSRISSDNVNYRNCRFNRRIKIAIRATVSEFDETSYIGSVMLFYYRISSFVIFGIIVWPYDFKTWQVYSSELNLNSRFKLISSPYDRISTRGLFHRVRNRGLTLETPAVRFVRGLKCLLEYNKIFLKI